MEKTRVPRLVGLTPGLARKLTKEAGLTPRLVGLGSCVSGCDPECGSRLKPGEMVTITLSEPNDSTFGGATTLADLRDFPLRDVIERAHWQGVSLTVHGSGWVTRQEPAPGTPLAGVRQLTVWLSADSCRAYQRMRENGM